MQEHAALKVSESTEREGQTDRQTYRHAHDSVRLSFIYLSLSLMRCSCKLAIYISSKLFHTTTTTTKKKSENNRVRAVMARCSHGDRRIRRWSWLPCGNKQMKTGADGVSDDRSSCFCAGLGRKQKIKQRGRNMALGSHVSLHVFASVATCESAALWRHRRQKK